MESVVYLSWLLLFQYRENLAVENDLSLGELETIMG